MPVAGHKIGPGRAFCMASTRAAIVSCSKDIPPDLISGSNMNGGLDTGPSNLLPCGPVPDPVFF